MRSPRVTRSFSLAKPGLALFLETQAEMFFMSRSEEHTSELQSQSNLVCRLLLEKKKLTSVSILFFFFFNDTATTEIYTLSLLDALPISAPFGLWQPAQAAI